MRTSTLGITLSIASILTLSASSGLAVKLADGTTSFDKSPHLIDMVTTLSTIWVWGAKYYVTVDLPNNAGEPLRKLTIHQGQGSDEIDYYLDETFAFEGTHTNRAKPLTLQAVTRDKTTHTISVVFEPPISPGTTFTVGLKPIRNPEYGGIYLFRITAFPVGEKPYGLDLGVGRLQFYEPSNNFLFRPY
jgi:hypothetical protein